MANVGGGSSIYGPTIATSSGITETSVGGESDIYAPSFETGHILILPLKALLASDGQNSVTLVHSGKNVLNITC